MLPTKHIIFFIILSFNYSIIFTNIFRTHKNNMRNLKKLLSDSGKVKRRRRMQLSIQITILSWSVESLSFFVIFLGTFILGNKNSIVTLSLQTLTAFCYLFIVPSMYLVSSNDFKQKILDNKVYLAFNNMCCYPCNDAMKEEDASEENEVDVERSANRENPNENIEINIRQISGNSDVEHSDTENGNQANGDEENGNLNQCKEEPEPTNEETFNNQTLGQKVKNAPTACVVVDLEK